MTSQFKRIGSPDIPPNNAVRVYVFTQDGKAVAEITWPAAIAPIQETIFIRPMFHSPLDRAVDVRDNYGFFKLS
jgi:hypothetical protein